MARTLDVINIAAPPLPPVDQAMPSACQSHGCGGAEEQRPPLSAFAEVWIDGVEITAEQIAEEMPHHPSPDGESAWRAAAQALVVRHLLLREASRRGCAPVRETDEAGKPLVDDEALIRSLLDDVAGTAVPSEEECRRTYDAQAFRFRTPTLYEASHILIEPEGAGDDDAWAAAEQQARTIIAEVGDERATFAEAAREFSGCPSAQQEGSLGQLRRGDLVAEVQTHIERTPVGTVNREPVRSRHGWHVIRLDRIIEGRTLPFEVVKPKIADLLEARAWTVAAMRLVQELADEAEIEGIALDQAPVGDARAGTLAA